MVSGLPRFTENFERLLENFQEYESIHWFFYFWKSDHSYDNRISPNWKNDTEWLKNQLNEILPSQNFIEDITIAEMPIFDTKKHFNIMNIASPLRVWTMFNGISLVNKQREKYERKNGLFDLVIRSRVDGTVDRPIFLSKAKKWLQQQSYESIIMPANGRLGFVPIGMELNPVNDNFAIGQSSTMSTYSDVLDYIDQYTNDGIPITAESMLGYHLLKNNIKAPQTDFNYNIGIGNFGRWI